MRYRTGYLVVVSYFDVDNERKHTRFSFNGNVDRRRIYRMLRRFLNTLGIHPRTEYLHWLVRNRGMRIGSEHWQAALEDLGNSAGQESAAS